MIKRGSIHENDMNSDNIHCSKMCILNFMEILLVDKDSNMGSKVKTNYAVTSIIKTGLTKNYISWQNCLNI